MKPACFLAALSVVTASVSSTLYRNAEVTVDGEIREETPNDDEKPGSIECGLWLAPSSLPGAGLGMYAGRGFKQGEAFQQSGDIVIPIVDLLRHNEYYQERWTFLWDEYTWGADGLKMDKEGYHEVNSASPGFGSAANSFLDLVNVDEWSTEWDNAGLNRSSDPGAGGFTTFWNRMVRKQLVSVSSS